MKSILGSLGFAAAAALTVGATVAVPAAPAAAAGMPVFDVTNYAQNLLQAARALDQINNQVKSLQNEASMLQNMAKNLKTISFPQLERIRDSMQRIQDLMDQAQAIDFNVDALDRQVAGLFPGAAANALPRNDRVAQARARLEAASAGYRHAMGVQAQVAENLAEDARLIDALVARSQGAVGALQAQQAASQLLALGVKQQVQLQALLASEFRSEALDRARRAQAEADGREATRRFLARPGLHAGRGLTPAG